MKPNPPSTHSGPSAVQAGGVRTAGKFFSRDGGKFFLNAVSYGPFGPNERGEPFPADARMERDFTHIRALGFNGVRIYDPPTPVMLDTASQHDLQLMVGVPWAEHVDFLSDSERRAEAEERVADVAWRLAGHPAVAAILVGNEIEKTLARWMGPRRVRDFLEKLIRIGRAKAPHTLFSYATYPSTEYLVPRNADFLAINVYLEERAAFDRYLLRLQNLAAGKPLVISEFGLDTRANGEAAQAGAIRWQREAVLKAGAAGNVWFSYTDEWQRGGAQVEGWQFGLVDRERKARAACEIAPTLPTALRAPGDAPGISVIICTRNGSATLRSCLEAACRQSRAAKEVIVVDDGSTDETPQIARSFPFVRYLRQEPAGLSVARNLGAQEATGEILAYTDDDCMPDEDWLARLSTAFDDAKWVAAGGPNIPPPPRSSTEALVAAAPGAPTHVLLHDEEAEHLPGCNLAIRKTALLEIGGFRPEFTTAGDDVDICWRLREAGGRLRFVPAAMVWHHRRLTARAYLRQQSGYGTAEALLMRHHPSRFGPLGGARWRGAIYGDGLGLRDPAEGAIFHGPFGLAPFQAIYPQGIAAWWDLFAGVLWVALALLALALRLPSVAIMLLIASGWAAWRRARQGWQAAPPASMAGRLLLWLLCWLQPIAREWSRLVGMVRFRSRPSLHYSLPEIIIPRLPGKRSMRAAVVSFWSEDGIGREEWLEAMRGLLEEKKVVHREDDGWRAFDIELSPRSWLCWAFASVTEYHGGSRRLTRVAVLRRVSKRGAAAMLAGLAALFFLITRAMPGFGWQGEVILLSLMLACLIVMHLVARASCVSLVRQAAARAGLQPMSGEKEPVAPKTSPLAAMNESCQNS